jgi:transposase
VRGLGCPVRFALTAGQKGDAPQAEVLLKDPPADVILADAAYDSDRLRKLVSDRGAKAVIPNNPSRARKYDLDKALYKERHLIECCFAKLKQFRRVATRYEKTARNYGRHIPTVTQHTLKGCRRTIETGRRRGHPVCAALQPAPGLSSICLKQLHSY